MMPVREELSDELKRLVTEGEALQRGQIVETNQKTLDDYRKVLVDSLAKEKDASAGSENTIPVSKKIVDEVLAVWVVPFRENYESWYSEALAMIEQVIPDRAQDFRDKYKVDKRKELTAETYGLSDYQVGLTSMNTYTKEESFNSGVTAIWAFTQQVNIVKAARNIIDKKLANIRGVLQADLFDSELDAARELLDNGYTRASGTLAGVVLEKHLADVVTAKGVKLGRKTATLANLTEALKSEGVLDVPRWRFIQGLADVRNLCAHAKTRDPAEDEVRELIEGVGRVIKTVN
jgi:hypothetical protein